MIVYDVQAQTVSVIPPSLFDTSIAFEQTPFSVGSLPGQTSLSLTPPVSNLFSGSGFSDIARAELFFNVTDYPIRTAVTLRRYNNDTLSAGCSGILVGKNLVLTAGHCIWYGGTWKSDSFLIAPAFDNGILQPGLPSSVVKKYYLFKSYYDGNLQMDYALLELKESIGDQIGWVGMAFHKDTSFYSTHVFHKLSYPGRANPCFPKKIYNGDTLYYNYGKISNSGSYLIVPGTEACGIPGQSGGSFFYTDNSNYYSVGIHIYSVNYIHHKIFNNVFYQFKNIMDHYATDIPETVNNESLLNTYPNPANSSITIQARNNKKGIYDLVLTNVYGQEVYFKNIEFADSYKLDLTGYNSGIYFLTLENKQERMIQKLVIQR